MVSKYRDPVTFETHHYAPFINLANHVLGKLDQHVDSILHFAATIRLLLRARLGGGSQTL